MDADLRDALTDIKTSIRGVSERVEDVHGRLTVHLISDATHKAASVADLNGLGRRLDDHMSEHVERKKWFLTLWIGMILTLAKAAWDILSKRT